jgi:hypothetical protein
MLMREVNERIAELLARADWGADAEFVCECGRPECDRRVTLRRRELETVRQRGRRVLAAECLQVAGAEDGPEALAAAAGLTV